MINLHLEMRERIKSAHPKDPVPTAAALADHLRHRRAVVGEAALVEFAYLQEIAAVVWGAAPTAHFGRVLRDARARVKPPRKTKWQKAEDVIAHLPDQWQAPMRRQVELSRRRSTIPDFTIWSASYAFAVTVALSRWARYAQPRELSLVPLGSTLDGYAQWLRSGAHEPSPVTLRTASDYLSRIHAGLAVVAPGSTSLSRTFVVRDLREAADVLGATTKTGSQLVGASTIYDLGFTLMNEARSCTMRGVHVAAKFRLGILLATAAALPQRARALSALDFATTLMLPGGGAIHVRIPADMLKMREDEKDDGEPFDQVFQNAELAAALLEYRHDFRPIFDDGSCLFPSVHARGHSVSEMQLGVLAGDITEARLGVRIPIHRMRDNVATEASENLDGGRRATKCLLDHAEIATGDHYDHSDGMKATREFGAFIDRQRSCPVNLNLDL
ncbi:MAG: hypothetical protein ACNA7O_17130 [Rhodobacterales bacterium]